MDLGLPLVACSSQQNLFAKKTYVSGEMRFILRKTLCFEVRKTYATGQRSDDARQVVSCGRLKEVFPFDEHKPLVGKHGHALGTTRIRHGLFQGVLMQYCPKHNGQVRSVFVCALQKWEQLLRLVAHRFCLYPQLIKAPKMTVYRFTLFARLLHLDVNQPRDRFWRLLTSVMRLGKKLENRFACWRNVLL